RPDIRRSCALFVILEVRASNPVSVILRRERANASEPRRMMAPLPAQAGKWHRRCLSSFEARRLRRLAPQDDGKAVRDLRKHRRFCAAPGTHRTASKITYA